MGIGDEIIASGCAAREHGRTGKRVVICGLGGAPRWHEMWEGLNYIVNPMKEDVMLADYASIINGGKCRPYIQYPFTVELGCTYNKTFRCTNNIGQIAFTLEETTFAFKHELATEKYNVLVEPNLADKSNPNKQWGFGNWQELVQLNRSLINWVQIGDGSGRLLDGVTFIQTPTFRHGAAVLARMHASILPEGGLMHAAGALNKAAVVLFGGATDPYVMGYPMHVKIFDDHESSPCGRWQPCGHCLNYWMTLTPNKVLRKLQLLLDGVLP